MFKWCHLNHYKKLSKTLKYWFDHHHKGNYLNFDTHALFIWLRRVTLSLVAYLLSTGYDHEQSLQPCVLATVFLHSVQYLIHTDSISFERSRMNISHTGSKVTKINSAIFFFFQRLLLRARFQRRPMRASPKCLSLHPCHPWEFLLGPPWLNWYSSFL